MLLVLISCWLGWRRTEGVGLPARDWKRWGTGDWERERERGYGRIEIGWWWRLRSRPRPTGARLGWRRRPSMRTRRSAEVAAVAEVRELGEREEATNRGAAVSPFRFESRARLPPSTGCARGCLPRPTGWHCRWRQVRETRQPRLLSACEGVRVGVVCSVRDGCGRHVCHSAMQARRQPRGTNEPPRPSPRIRWSVACMRVCVCMCVRGLHA